jgi:hypothetical protein
MDENCADYSERAEILLRPFSVGFVRLGPERSYSAGSGTLVRIGTARGILTAGHVLAPLEDRGEIGVLQFPRVARKIQNLKIDVQKQRCIFLGRNEDQSSTGPDIAFLRLNGTDANLLESRDFIFFDLLRRQQNVIAPEQEGERVLRAVVGVVAELTSPIEPTDRSRRTDSYTAIIGVGLIRGRSQAGDFDLIHFEPIHGDEFQQPGSYAGMSGGPLWRMRMDDNLEVHLVGVEGVMFYETPETDPRRLICHGPVSIYERLVPVVLQNEVAQTELR